jgi:hypothetical protein
MSTTPSGRAADAISAWAPFAVSKRAAVKAGRSSRFASSFPFARPRLVASAAARFSDYGFWLCPRRSSRRAGCPANLTSGGDCVPTIVPHSGSRSDIVSRHNGRKVPISLQKSANTGRSRPAKPLRGRWFAEALARSFGVDASALHADALYATHAIGCGGGRATNLARRRRF